MDPVFENEIFLFFVRERKTRESVEQIFNCGIRHPYSSQAHPDGRREAVLFVVEEESDPRRFSIHRLGRYCLDLAELFETDRVVPVVIFLRGVTVRRELTLGGDRHVFLSFRYLACDLAELPFERYVNSDNRVACLNLPNMRYEPARRVEVFAHAVRGLCRLEPDPEKQIKYLEFIDIYTGLDDNERARYARDYPEEARIMSTFAERFIQQGRREEDARILIRLLQHKFGDLPETVRQRIEAADADTLLE